MNLRNVTLFPVLLVSLIGCWRRQDGLTREEAAQAVEELQLDSQSQALTASTVEISTNFTIGDAVEKAADDLRSFIQSQLPCAAITLSGHTLRVEYGSTGVCLHNGNAFTGVHTISIASNDAAEVVVDHTWEEVSNGKVQVDGTATVTWDLDDPSRHVEHDVVWTSLTGSTKGRSGRGTGNRVQRPLGGEIAGLKEGFTEDGARSWDGERGHWQLDIDHLEMRWIDPVPQEGSLTLDTPFDKTLTLGFTRLNPTTIKVSVEGPNHSFDINVNSLP